MNISLANASQRERQTRDQLVALLQCYDLRRWQVTDAVRIEQGVIPHSHPVLTLSTYLLGDDARLLAIYLHEQLHWFCDQREAAVERAIEELRRIYLVVPVGLPEGGKSEFSSYLHLVIGSLEYLALVELIGTDEARLVIESWTHYTWIHATIQRDIGTIRAIVERHDLLP